MLSGFFVRGRRSHCTAVQAYPPLSALQSAGPGEGAGADLWVIKASRCFCVGAFDERG